LVTAASAEIPVIEWQGVLEEVEEMEREALYGHGWRIYSTGTTSSADGT